MHDVVGGPTLGGGLHRAAESREGRGDRSKSASRTAVGLLQGFAQVGREDIALDERVTQDGDAHGASVEQFAVERMQRAVSRRVEILDRLQRFDHLGRLTRGVVGRQRIGGTDPPFETGLHGRRERVGCLDGGCLPGYLLRHAVQVDVELLLVKRDLRGCRSVCRRAVVEFDQIREYVGSSERDAADGLRRDQAHAAEHDNQGRDGQPRAMDVLFLLLFLLHASEVCVAPVIRVGPES